MSFENHFDSEADLRRYEALLEMADLMVHHRSLPELFVDLAERLHKVTPFEFATFSLYDPTKNVMKLHIWEGRELAPIQPRRRSPTPQQVGFGNTRNRWCCRTCDQIYVFCKI